MGRAEAAPPDGEEADGDEAAGRRQRRGIQVNLRLRDDVREGQQRQGQPAHRHGKQPAAADSASPTSRPAGYSPGRRGMPSSVTLRKTILLKPRSARIDSLNSAIPDDDHAEKRDGQAERPEGRAAQRPSQRQADFGRCVLVRGVGGCVGVAGSGCARAGRLITPATRTAAPIPPQTGRQSSG